MKGEFYYLELSGAMLLTLLRIQVFKDKKGDKCAEFVTYHIVVINLIKK